MPVFKPFDLGAAQAQGTQNAFNTMRTMTMADKINQTNAMRQYAKQGIATGEDPSTLAMQGGHPEIANQFQVRKMQKMKTDISKLLYLKNYLPYVRDQATLDQFNKRSTDMGAPQGMLPKAWNANTRARVNTILGRADKALQKLSPGTSLVGKTPEGGWEEKYRAPYTPRQRGKGRADKPSTAAKKRRELIAQGVPPEIATGVAYGGIKIVKDTYSQDATLINTITGKVHGKLVDGVYTPEQDTTAGTVNKRAYNLSTGKIE